MKINENVLDAGAFCSSATKFKSFENALLDFASSAGMDGVNAVLPREEGKLAHRANLLLMKRRHPELCTVSDRLIMLSELKDGGLFNPALQAAMAMNAGFDSIELVLDKHGKYADESPLTAAEYESFFRFLSATGFHLRLSFGAPSFSPAPRGARAESVRPECITPDEWKENTAVLIDFLDRYPGLNVTLVSGCYLSENDSLLRSVLDSYPSVTMDLCPGFQLFSHFSQDPAKGRSFFLEYSDRLLFASGCSADAAGYSEVVATIRSFLETDEEFFTFPLLGQWGIDLRGLYPLSEEILSRIYSENWLRVIGGVRSVNTEKVLDYLKITDGMIGGLDDCTEQMNTLRKMDEKNKRWGCGR